MTNFTKRTVTLLLAVMMVIGMLTAIVPTSVSAEKTVPSVWKDNGLAPLVAGEVVEIPTEQQTGNSTMFLAPDWTAYAKYSATGTAGEVTERSTDPALADQLPLGFDFYATMPTTGITYKLKYGINAANTTNINTGLYNRLVLFPGRYHHTSYSVNSNVTADGVTSSYGFSNDSTKVGKGAIAIGYSKRYNSGGTADIVVLGPKAGIVAADVKNGTPSAERSVTDLETEAIFDSSYIYMMNAALYDGRTTTFDGLSIKGTNYICTFYENAGRFTNCGDASKVVFNNMYIDKSGASDEPFFCLWNYVDGKTNGKTKYPYDSAKLNTAKFSLGVYINGSYIEAPANKRMGEFIADQLCIDNSVLYNRSADVTADSVAKSIGLLVQPTAPANHPDHVDNKYSITNSYLKGAATAPMGIYWNYAPNCTSENRSLEIKLHNNRIVDCAMNTKNSTRSHVIALYTVNAAIKPATKLIYTDNTVINTIQQTPTHGYVFNGLNGVDATVSGNTFTGFTQPVDNMSSSVDISENIFYDFNNQLIVGSPKSGSYTKVMLGDFDHSTDDLAVTFAANSYKPVLPAGNTVLGTSYEFEGQPITVPFKTGMTVSDIVSGAAVGSKAEVKAFLSSDKSTAATSVTQNETYYLRVGFKTAEGKAYTALYPVIAKTCDTHQFGNTLVYDATGHWYECSVCHDKKDFAAHKFDNDCDATCNQCGYTRTVNHSVGQWLTDATYHWHKCSSCLETVDKAEHTYDNDCDTTCNVCGAVRTVTHQYGNPLYTATEHWLECALCHNKKDISAHTFDNACDTSCNGCGYTRTTTHQYSQSWSGSKVYHWHECSVCHDLGDFDMHQCGDTLVYDATGHWYECSVCQGKIDFAAHTFDNDCDATCSDCGYTRTASHQFAQTWTNNSTKHWRVCTACNTGFTDKGTHTWDGGKVTKKATVFSTGIKTFTCTVCGRIKNEIIPKTVYKKDAAKDFADIKAKDWFYEPVNFAYNENLFGGMSKTKFAPNANMTRAMFVTVLGRLSGVKDERTLTRFEDVKKSDYFSGYVKWASDAGIVSGVSPKRFAPNANVTREQICKMMVEYCKFSGIKLKAVNKPITFGDANKISAWAKNYVSQCQTAGLVGGSLQKSTGKMLFDPQGNATRAQVAQILYNFYKNYLIPEDPQQDPQGEPKEPQQPQQPEQPEQPEQPTVNILFIGNSFTFFNEMPDMFADICESAGKKVNTVRVAIGSARLTYFLDPAYPEHYNMLETALKDNTFDYVFIQEQSARPYKSPDEFKSGAKGVLARVKKSNPNCKAYLYETWGYNELKDSMLEDKMTTKEQEKMLFDAYKSLGAEMGVPVSYAGVTHYRVYKETKIEAYNTDLMHPSYGGSYAAAMTHFFTLFPKAEPDDVTFAGELSAKDAFIIRKLAYEVVHSNDPSTFIK